MASALSNASVSARSSDYLEPAPSEAALAIKMMSKGIVVDLTDIVRCEEGQDLFVLKGNMIAVADDVRGFADLKIRLTYPTLSKLKSLIAKATT